MSDGCIADLVRHLGFGPQEKNSSSGKFTYICHFKRVGINAKKFERIHFNSDVFPSLAIIPLLFKRPVFEFITVILAFWFYRKLRRRKSVRIR